MVGFLAQRRFIPVWLIMAAVLLGAPAYCGQSAFRTYDATQGLTNLGGRCMRQDRTGYMFLCSDHGVFAYDGKHFVNLGPDQGLRQGGYVKELAVTRSGRLAVAFADQVLVADRATDAYHPPINLSFRSVLHPGQTFFDEQVHHLAAWRDGLVMIAGSSTERIVIPDTGAPYVEAMGYDLEEQALLNSPASVFPAGGAIWEGFADGRLCRADPGAVKCYTAAEGLAPDLWQDVTAGPDGRIIARSPTTVATLEQGTNRWIVDALPDQGGRYLNYRNNLKLFTSPDGRLATQAEHGLAVLGPSGWRVLAVKDGAPSGIIVDAMTDADGQYWFQIFGSGLVRSIGYGHWEHVQKAEGLSEGIAWRTVQGSSGQVWVSTDTGVDELVRRQGALRVSRVLDGAGFALAVGPRGEIWRGYGDDGVRVLDPQTGAESRIAVPSTNGIVPGPGASMWLGTQAGLFRAEGPAGGPYRVSLEGSRVLPVSELTLDTKGGAFYVSGGRLRHRRPDGSDVAVTGAWPLGLDPMALALDRDGSIWIGGAGGLFRFTLAGDHLTSFQPVPVTQTRTNTISAIMIDHRDWVWIGTAQGLSVFDRKRWVSVDADAGLSSDDVDQEGLREDEDGSVWITTNQGVSHLLDVDWLFAARPGHILVSSAELGSRPVQSGVLPYSREGLSIEFGTPDHAAERSFLFRYHLSGVDEGWVESPSYLAHYPSLPPGRHVLTVVGYNQLTHLYSPPAELVVEMDYPWWRQWWSEAIWLLAAAGIIYGAMRLRFRALLARQAELKRRVAEATEQLRFQAAHDTLTGLLNRSEIERRLAAKLAGGLASDEMLIALLDIDNFKRVNDSYGHLGGDDVLRTAGRLVRKAVRAGEYAGRYGGEEILLVLDDSDGRGAERVLELHHTIRGTPFNAAGRMIRVTCSIGVAWAAGGDDWESLIGRADDALYVAKASGRDKVVETNRTDAVAREGAGDPGITPGASLA